MSATKHAANRTKLIPKINKVGGFNGVFQVVFAIAIIFLLVNNNSWGGFDHAILLGK